MVQLSIGSLALHHSSMGNWDCAGCRGFLSVPCDLHKLKKKTNLCLIMACALMHHDGVFARSLNLILPWKPRT